MRKRIISLLMALVMVCSCCFTATIAQADDSETNTQITLTSLHGETKITDTAVELWMTFTGGTWSDWSDWSMTWEPFVYEFCGVQKKVSIVQSAGTNLLYVTIPVSDIPTTAGTRITIKSGDYAAQSGTSTGMSVTNDFEVVLTSDKPVAASQYEVVEVGSATVIHGTAEQIQFSLNDKSGDAFTFGYHTAEVWNKHFLTPVNKDGNRCAGSSEWNELNSGVFQNDSAINYWPNGGYNFQEINSGVFYIGGLNATEGTVVTVNGAFTLSDGSSWALLGDKYFIFEKFSFTYTNGSWVFSRPYQEITLNGLHGNTSNDANQVTLWMTFTGGTWSDWSDWNNYWYPFVYEIDGVRKQVSIVQSAGENLLYVTIPASDVPTEAGTKITIKAGDYAAKSGISKGICITSDFEIIMTGDKPVVASQYDVLKVGSATVIHGTADQIQFSLKDQSGSAVTFGYHTAEAWNKHFLTPVNKDGNRCAGSDEWNALKSGVFQDDSAINYWPNGGYNFQEINHGVFYIGGLSATEGTVVTIKGAFALSDGSTWALLGDKYFIFEELSFTYTNGTWISSKIATEPSRVSLDFVDLLTISNYNTTFGKWELYLSTTKALPGTEETTTFDVLMNVGGQEQTVTAKKSSQQQAFAFEIDASMIPENPTEEIALTIKAGTYDVSGEETKLTIENDKTLYFANGIVDVISSKVDADEKNIVFTLDRAEQAGGTVKGIYLTATDNVPYDTSWATDTIACDGKLNGVFLNGVKTNAFLKKYAAEKYYVCLSDVNVVPEEGDRVVVKGAFKTGNYISSYQEYAVTFKDGSWVDGTEPETRYTTVTVTDYDTNVSKYNEALERWEFYFATKEELPGEVDQRFESILANINGEEYHIPCYHGSHRDNLFLIIEKDKLPKIVNDDQVKVTISGKAKSVDQLIGIDVQPFTLYMNKYGQSLDGFPSAIDVKEKNVKLTLDTVTFGWTAGTELGINLYTDDGFKVDNTWQTPIRPITYDDNSGIFYNGTKIDGYLKKHADGLIYLDINAAGIVAKDKDAVTIKGTFALDGYGVSYAEQTFYWNGQKWATTYSEPIPKTSVKLNPVGIKKNSSYNSERKAWDIYVQVDKAIPGTHDYEYRTLVYEVDDKSYETSVYRVDDSLVFFVPENIVPKDAKDGTGITLKAGTASDNYGIYDIELTGDCTAYVYRKAISGIKPTENTKYLNLTIPGLLRTWSFNEELKEWQLFFKVDEKFDVEDGTKYYDLPVKLNGKSYEEISVFRSGECLYISIPESVLSRNTKSAELTIAKGAKAVANAGWNGIQLNNEVKVYMFDGVWNNVKFTEHETTDITIKHMNFCSYNSDVSRWDIYVNVDKELPGTAWFEYFEGMTAYLNGKKYTTYTQKAESGNNRLMYISLPEDTFGKFKEGDILYIPGDATYKCGGYQLHNTRDFYLQYVNGMWLEYYESDLKAPLALDSLWEKFRIDGYIPVQEEQGIMFANVEPTNVIKSVEDMKDVTFTFKTTKMLAMNEELPTNSLILRGQPLNEEMGISETALYGYNISFSYIELTESNTPNNPELWGTHSQEIAVWKNGINYNLLDQYRMTYNWQKTNHPFFEYNETYEYTVSIYNVEQDVCVIEVYCNGELVMRVVDHASDDPKDPARNAGEFRIYAACPQYFYAPAVELDSLEVSASECYIGEQVRVSATYPAILEGAEYTVDGENATMKDGVFMATKAGTYTVSGSYNGVDKGTVQIKVTEKPQEDVAVEETSNFPIIPVAITGGSLLIVASIVLALFLKKKKK